MRILFLVIALASFWAKANVPENFGELIKFEVKKETLPNGLTVIVHEDHSVPVMAFHQWFRVGSRDETPGRTGLAHFFEHLMFKGTKKYKGDDFDRLIQANGGVNNAFTTKDYTGYYFKLPPDKLELAIDIESDRMRNLVFDPKEIKSEREVVKEERRFRVDNSVMGFLWQQIFSTVFKVHPYRWPVIGYMRDLNAATIDDLKDFYKVHYSPNNAVVVIAGDIDADRAMRLVKKYYGNIPAQKLPGKKGEDEPGQKGQRNATFKKDVQSATMAIVYKGPKAGEKDAYTLDIAANILGTGDSSRLVKRLVYGTQLMSRVSAFNYTPKEPGIFQVSGAMRPGQNRERAEKIIFSELYKLRTKPVSEKELQKAKNQIMADYVSGLKTVHGKANAIAINEILFGDYKMLFKDLEMYQSVTVEDVQKAAEQYLKPAQRSVLRVLPKTKEQEGA
ncbi:MAG: insulinase family protein [Bdellovibrionales bacterium]|nr:insulinase family protein [Bdellovibrionales bacterium]